MVLMNRVGWFDKLSSSWTKCNFSMNCQANRRIFLFRLPRTSSQMYLFKFFYLLHVQNIEPQGSSTPWRYNCFNLARDRLQRQSFVEHIYSHNGYTIRVRYTCRDSRYSRRNSRCTRRDSRYSRRNIRDSQRGSCYTHRDSRYTSWITSSLNCDWCK